MFESIFNRKFYFIKTGKLVAFVLNALLFSSCGSELTDNKVESNSFNIWHSVGGDKGLNHYSTLNEIDTSNVNRLEVAWVYKSGDVKYDSSEFWGGSTIQSNPIVIGKVIYSTTPTLQLVALDAVTGKEIWKFNPREGKSGGGYNRGVAYWENHSDKRLFYTVGNELLAINANTGKLIENFGIKGRHQMGDSLSGGYSITSPAAPGIYKDLVIVAGMTWNERGRVCAFDVKTGEKNGRSIPYQSLTNLAMILGETLQNLKKKI